MLNIVATSTLLQYLKLLVMQFSNLSISSFTIMFRSEGPNFFSDPRQLIHLVYLSE